MLGVRFIQLCLLIKHDEIFVQNIVFVVTIHLGGVCFKWLGYGFVEDDMWNPSDPAYRTRIGPAMVIQDLIAFFLWPTGVQTCHLSAKFAVFTSSDLRVICVTSPAAFFSLLAMAGMDPPYSVSDWLRPTLGSKPAPVFSL